jgi:hypothetical protein
MIVNGGRFDPENFRHRRILDESEPLADPVLEEARRIAVVQRRMGNRREAPWALRDFARLVAERSGSVARGG